jgi:hypothetical protein
MSRMHGIVLLLLLGGCTLRPSVVESSVSSPNFATLVVATEPPMCSGCVAGLAVALIQIKYPSGRVAWSSIAGREPGTLSIRAGSWQIEYFCSGVLDFDGHQQVTIESGATYLISCGSLPNYQLQLHRLLEAPNRSSKRTREKPRAA